VARDPTQSSKDTQAHGIRPCSEQWKNKPSTLRNMAGQIGEVIIVLNVDNPN